MHAGAEDCDDGNHDADDGCVLCRWARCGDGKTRAGVEECDTPGVASCTAKCISCAPATGLNAYSGTADGHCYTLSTVNGAVFEAAATTCQTQAGHLLTAAGAAEASAIATGLGATGETWRDSINRRASAASRGSRARRSPRSTGR